MHFLKSYKFKANSNFTKLDFLFPLNYTLCTLPIFIFSKLLTYWLDSWFVTCKVWSLTLLFSICFFKAEWHAKKQKNRLIGKDPANKFVSDPWRNFRADSFYTAAVFWRKVLPQSLVLKWFWDLFQRWDQTFLWTKPWEGLKVAAPKNIKWTQPENANRSPLESLCWAH